MIRLLARLALLAWVGRELVLWWRRRRLWRAWDELATYPNTYGVRTTPLTPAERDVFLGKRTPSPPAAESLGSSEPAASGVPTAVRPPA